MRKLLTFGLTIGILFGISAVSAKATSQCPKVCTKYEYKCHWEGWHLKCGNECVKEERVCPIPTPEPTPEVTPEPTPEVTPEPTPEVTPEPTPEVTPTPTQVPEQPRVTSFPGAPVLPVCPNFWPVGPSNLTFKRLSPTSIAVWWNKIDSFVKSYVVSYGPAKNLLVWNTIVNGSEYTELHQLPANQHIWIGVQQAHSGCVGALGNVIDP